MVKAIEWAESQGIPCQGMSPGEFALAMDDALGTETAIYENPEIAAQQWLRAINDCSSDRH